MKAKSSTPFPLAGWLALGLVLATSVGATERQVLSGHVPAATMRSQPVSRLPATSRLNLAIGLPLRNQEVLNALLERLYDPASPQYRHYLTSEQFAERYGPAREDYETVIEFAKSCGLTVTATHPNRTLLDVAGSPEDIEKAFHVKLQVYRHPSEARTFHAPDVEPSVDLAIPILHVAGLNNFNQPRPLAHRRIRTPGSKPKSLSGAGPGGAFLGKDFRAVYVPGVTLTGAGQSVALLEYDSYYASDITAYESLAGLPNVPLQNVYFSGFDGTKPGSGNSEVALDIEMAISMAPGLSAVVVYAGGGSETDTLNRIATDNLCKQISCSWTMSFDATTDQVFKQYAAQGQSFFQASGDWGPNPGGWVADDPYIITVGGTELTTSGPGGGWVAETVWNIGYNLGQYSSISSGGGISTTYSIPSWQKGLSMTTNHGSTFRRNSPDVSMVADNIWVFSDNGDSGEFWGTSAAAPLWAGFSALANELAATKAQPPVGFINPAIYALGKGGNYTAAFHDITVGNNITTASTNNFFAVPGYDLCSGWGTPTGSNLLYALALPQLLQITPETNFSASGTSGGPFTPITQSYSLTNSGSAALAWSLANTALWLDASSSAGTIAPGDPAAIVTLSPNATANTLPVGNYTANLWFTNLNDGSIQTRVYTLVIQPTPQTAPIIVAQSTNQAVLEGATAQFSVGVSPTSLPVSYTWIRNGIVLSDGGNFSGTATSTLSISNVSANEVGDYSVVVMNSMGAATGYLSLLTIASPPVVLAQPTDQTVLPGATAKFNVEAIGTKPLFYQWQNNGANVTSGGNTNVLMLRNVTTANVGTYSVVVSNVLGVVTNGAAMLILLPVTVPGVTLATLYSFKGGGDGANPSGQLVQATNGNFYGTTHLAGANGVGTVFRMTPDGALTTIRAFAGGNDGATPGAGLIQARDGNLYGTTYGGGAYGFGVVFRITLTGGLAILHPFTGGNDGGGSFARLLQAADGNFYGTASQGGTNGNGIVFKMTPGGTLTALHSFTGTNGAIPRTGLIQARDGNLYGVTRRGGASSYDGTLFAITTAGALTTLFEGSDTERFSPRDRLLQGSDGNFYGTTTDDGPNRSGTVFKMTPTGLLTRIYSFTGGSDGQWPRGALVEAKDGYFYGTTMTGGIYGSGTVFRLAPSGALTTLVQFDEFNGANPTASLVQASDGAFYGTTLNGGASGFGTVFRFSVPEPTLSIASSGGQVILSWPSWASDLRLEQSSDLSASIWTAVTNSLVVTNLQNQVVLRAPSSGNMFYKLTH
jgi:uncharacterized repeat protein (TIGR03803 family)